MNQFPAPPYPSVSVAPPAPAGKRGVLRWALGVAAVLAAFLTGLCTLWLIGYETGLVPFLAGREVAGCAEDAAVSGGERAIFGGQRGDAVEDEALGFGGGDQRHGSMCDVRDA